MGNKRHLVALLALLQERRPDVADPEGFIRRGRVLVDGYPVTNARARVSRGSSVRIREEVPLRGERKMHGALKGFGLQLRGTTALDAGAAAGGFTKALLDAGAHRVYAVDVGHGQLLGSIRLDGRVVVLERTNIADLTRALVPDPLSVITLDLSYLSLAEAVPQLNVLDISSSAVLVALVKPMFELGAAELPKPTCWQEAVEAATRAVDAAGWHVRDVMRSPILGRGGAVEFFLLATRR
jgi:23S rRNA (cytidine1920-2'-O)/16S rRNA (cytidine1409-2'-O)-methyltransferase